MAQHRFKVGDLVRIGGTASANQGETFMDARVHARPTGIFEVMACLPEVDGEAQYRIKGGDDQSQRIVRESQLVLAARKPSAR